MLIIGISQAVLKISLTEGTQYKPTACIQRPIISGLWQYPGISIINAECWSARAGIFNVMA
jgi:hypothetical protein